MTMGDLGMEKGQVWRVDPHRPNPSDVEIIGSGTRNGRSVVIVRSVLPGGFTGREERPVDLLEFVRHAVLLCGSGERREYDSSDWREPFVR